LPNGIFKIFGDGSGNLWGVKHFSGFFKEASLITVKLELKGSHCSWTKLLQQGYVALRMCSRLLKILLLCVIVEFIVSPWHCVLSPPRGRYCLSCWSVLKAAELCKCTCIVSKYHVIILRNCSSLQVFELIVKGHVKHWYSLLFTSFMFRN
jgi:hypothetical protein